MILHEIGEYFVMSFEALKSNPIRSFLASLGVVVGISIVIMMGWLITGLDNALKETNKILGLDMMYVDKWDWSGRSKNWRDMEARKDIELDQVWELKNRCKSAQCIIPNLNNWGQSVVYNGETFKGMSSVGVTSDNQYTPAGELIAGRYFSELEDKYSTSVVVISYNVYTTVFPNGDAIGKTIKIKGRKLEVIGVVKKRGTMFFDMIDNQCFLPLRTFMSMYGNDFHSMSIGIKAGSEAKLDEVRDEVTGLLRVIRNVPPGKENDFAINETKAFESSMAEIRKSVWGVGIGMTALSFLVGMIGIMNIMFVSVAERTKEIGIRKAIGAKRRSIWAQFLIEASTLSLLGAFLSLVFCSILVLAISFGVNKYNPSITFLSPILPVDLAITSTIVSLVAGILAGIIPAIRAARLDPIEALRSD